MNIKQLVQQLQLPSPEQITAEQLLYYAETQQVSVGLFGSFSVGKSKLLNKLLERECLLPTHTNETTAVVTRIIYGDEERAELTYTNGTVEEVLIEDLEAYVVGEAVEKIEKITVVLSSPSWLEQIEFIDTPGRNTKYEAHIAASKQAIVEADAAIYVLPWQGVTVEDIVYLKDLMLYQPNLYFVLNKVDRIEEGQGQTIEEVRQKVEAELSEQLGQAFPVFAVSAKTGFHLDQLRQSLIPQILNNIHEIKRVRFCHAIQQLLLRHEVFLQNKLYLQELACTKDELTLEDQIRSIEVEQKKVEEKFNKELAITKRLLATLQNELGDFVELTIRHSSRQLEAKLTPISNAKIDPSSINMLIENELLHVRNQVYKQFEQKLSKFTAERINHSLSEVEQTSINIKYCEPNFTDLQAMYEKRLQSLSNQYREKKGRLEGLSNGQFTQASEDEQQSLKQAIVELEDQMLEEYIPQYVGDEYFDREKFTKILGYVGKAGDIVVGIAAAVATAGASAGVQIAGKAGAQVAKEAGKQVTKETIKQAGKAVVKEAGKQVAKETGKELAKQYGLEALKVVGAMTSPVETVAENIGKIIDQTRSPEQFLDQQHRHQFFMKKQKLEEKYVSLKRELHELRDEQKANDSVARSVMKKLQELEAKHSEEVKGLEQAVKQDQELLRQKDFEISIKNQLHELLSQEKANYLKWIQLELEQVALMLEKTVPAYYEEEFTKWKQQMEHLKETFHSEQEAVKQDEEATQNQLQLCAKIRELLRNDS